MSDSIVYNLLFYLFIYYLFIYLVKFQIYIIMIQGNNNVIWG